MSGHVTQGRKKKKVALIQELLADKCKLEEWLSILDNTCGGKRSTNPFEIYCYEKLPADRNYDAYVLKLKFGKRRSLIEVCRGPLFTDTIRDKIVSDVKSKLLINQEPCIARLVLFSSVPVKGYWRFKDEFQILPPGDNWVKPPFLAAEHPFLVEVKIQGSKDQRILLGRLESKRKEMSHFLNLFLNCEITYLGGRRMHHQWVVIETQENQIETKYASRSYSIKDFEPLAEVFSDTEALDALEIQDSAQYFGSHANVQGLRISNLTIHLFEAISVLDSEKRSEFLKATYWFYKSDRINNESSSAALVGLISAIEALLPDIEHGTKCEACGYSPNKKSIGDHFRDFLTNFAKGTTEEEQYELYDVRSRIVHGGHLLTPDSLSMASLMSPSWQIDSKKYYRARQITQISLINWLGKISSQR